MRQLYLVCVKCKHIKFMSEAPSALSLCFKLGIYKYIFLSSFHLDFVENLRSSQVEKKIQWSYLLQYDIMSPLFLIMKLTFRC